MECSTRIGPSIVRVVQIVRASAIARNRANVPIVTAKLQWFCWGKCRCTSALDNLYESHGTPRRGRYIHGWERVIIRRRSEEHTSELQSPCNLVCRLLLE